MGESSHLLMPVYVSLTLGSFVFIIWLILEATIITTVMKAYLVIVLEHKDKVQYQRINHHQPSSMIINDHQSSSIKEWIFTPFLIFRSLRRRTGVNCHFFTKVGKLLTLAPDVRLRFLKKGKWSELNFWNFWPGFRHLRPNTNTQIHKYTNTQRQIHNNANYTILKWSVLFSKTIHFDQPLTHCAFSVQCSAMDIIIITIIITITIIMTLWCSAMASISSSSSNQCLPNSSWAIPKCIDQNIIPRLIQCSLRNFLPSLPY